MDLDKLSLGDRVIAISGILLLIFSFFKWLGIKVSGASVAGHSFVGASDSKSAWSFALTLIAVLIGIAMVAVVLLKLADVKLPTLGSVTWGQVLLAAGAIAFLFVLIKLITGPSGWNGFDIPSGIDKTRKFGIFAGLVCSAGLAVGGYLRFQEDAKGASGSPPAA
jgi:hypothetical protein